MIWTVICYVHFVDEIGSHLRTRDITDGWVKWVAGNSNIETMAWHHMTTLKFICFSVMNAPECTTVETHGGNATLSIHRYCTVAIGNSTSVCPHLEPYDKMSLGSGETKESIENTVYNLHSLFQLDSRWGLKQTRRQYLIFTWALSIFTILRILSNLKINFSIRESPITFSWPVQKTFRYSQKIFYPSDKLFVLLYVIL